ncbi:MAG: hypothetical protein JSS50_02965 [Proteobacteria bacterium]|nr:hypothetical protein [Pseudomonadota bacterium]
MKTNEKALKLEKEQSDISSNEATGDNELSGVESNKSDGEKNIEICPITNERMRDPVIAPDGVTYERTAITEWLQLRGTSPYTKEPMAADFRPNLALKKQIEETDKIKEAAKRLEHEKERAARREEKAKKKLKKMKQEQSTTEQRLARLEQMAVMQGEMLAVQNEKIARQEEKISRMEEDLEYVYHANAKRAKECAIRYQDKVTDDAKLLGFALGGIIPNIGTLASVITGAGLLMVGSTIVTGGTIWIVVGVIMGTTAVLGIGTGAGVYYYANAIHERDYERDRVLIDTTLQAAMSSGKAEALGPIQNLLQFTLSGLLETMSYAMGIIGKAVEARIQSWRASQTLTAAQQTQYLEDIKTSKSTNPTVLADSLYKNIKHAYDKGQMALVATGSGSTEAVWNPIIEAGNKKLQEGSEEERAVKGSIAYTLATTAVCTGIKAIKDSISPDCGGAVYIMAVSIDKGYATKQTEQQIPPKQ